MKKRCSFQHQSFPPFFFQCRSQAEFSEKNHSKKGQSAPFYQKEVSVLAPESLQHNIIVRFPLWWFAKKTMSKHSPELRPVRVLLPERFTETIQLAPSAPASA